MQAITGIGCDEDTLSRVIGGFDKRDACALAARYFANNDADLVVEIKESTGGCYEDALVAYLTLEDATKALEYRLHLDPSSIAACLTNVKVGGLLVNDVCVCVFVFVFVFCCVFI